MSELRPSEIARSEKTCCGATIARPADYIQAMRFTVRGLQQTTVKRMAAKPKTSRKQLLVFERAECEPCKKWRREQAPEFRKAGFKIIYLRRDQGDVPVLFAVINDKTVFEATGTMRAATSVTSVTWRQENDSTSFAVCVGIAGSEFRSEPLQAGRHVFGSGSVLSSTDVLRAASDVFPAGLLLHASLRIREFPCRSGLPAAVL